MFNVRGERLPLHFSLGAECEAAGVEAAAVFQDGLAVLTPGGQLWCGRGVVWPGRRAVCEVAGAAGGGREFRVPCRMQPQVVASPAVTTALPPLRACCLNVCIPDTCCLAHACRCVPDTGEPRLQRFPDPAPSLAAAAGAGGSSGVHCMTVLPPSLSSSGALEVREAGWALPQADWSRRCCVSGGRCTSGPVQCAVADASTSGRLRSQQVIVAVEETVRVIDANEALPTSVFEGPILR